MNPKSFKRSKPRLLNKRYNFRHTPRTLQLLKTLCSQIWEKQSLCQHCASIDLDAAFKLSNATSTRERFVDLGQVIVRDTSCRLCNLLASITPDIASSSTEPYLLNSFPCSQSLDWGWNTLQKVGLQIQVGRYPTWPNPKDRQILISRTDTESSIRMIKPELDLAIVKEWLGLCLGMHTKTCGASNSSSYPSAAVPSFKLIDCKNRQIVRPSCEQYVSLSYVWGKASHDIPYSDTLPTALPNTIEDAITVTLELGFSYLWIDRYCINQKDLDELQEHVSRMDLIYDRSAFTIVAAAGEDPHFGLPGIGQTPRRLRPKVRIGDRWLISAPADPTAVIKRSAWNERGWTYQEALLSHRRLIFTDREVYYECRGMYCFETLNIPLLDLHMYGGQRISSNLCHGVDLGMFPKQLGSNAWEITTRIEEYSRRALSNPNDILKGFLGIFQVFETGSLRLGHCCGIPVFPTRPRPSTAKEYWESLWSKDLESYNWSLMVGFCCGLCWDVERPAERRKGFPSWSWTGWCGPILWRYDQMKEPDFRIDPDLTLRVQFENGKSVDIETFAQHPSEERLQPSLMLHITAWCSDVVVSSTLDETSGQVCKYEYFVDVEGRGRRPLHVLRTGKSRTSNEAYVAIHLANGNQAPRSSNGLFIYLLIVQEVEPANSIYERVGLGTIAKTRRDYALDKPPIMDEEYGLPLLLNNKPLPKLIKRKQELWIC